MIMGDKFINDEQIRILYKILIILIIKIWQICGFLEFDMLFEMLFFTVHLGIRLLV